MIVVNTFRVIGWVINFLIILVCGLIIFNLVKHDIGDASILGFTLIILLLWSTERHDLYRGKRKNNEG